MANDEHLEILKAGVRAWNHWRHNSGGLKWVDLSRANLKGMDLSQADLNFAHLGSVNLSDANLTWTNLRFTDLDYANLKGANLTFANLFRANLTHANLEGATLNSTNLSHATLDNTNFSLATMGSVTFANNDLSTCVGLDTIIHFRPSSIGIDTIYKSKENMPENFLKGVGLSDVFITYMPTLLEQPIKFYSCFISYSSKDQGFAERLYADLQNKGVRCWFAPKDLRTGDEIRNSIDEAIRLREKVLIILSKHSVASTWVEHEVESALEEEGKINHNRSKRRLMLFPIRLDNSVFKCDQAWAALIRRTRHIADFRRWKDYSSYQVSFNQLLRDLSIKGASTDA